MIGGFSDWISISCECKFVCPVYSDSHTNDSYDSVLFKLFKKRTKCTKDTGLNQSDESFVEW